MWGLLNLYQYVFQVNFANWIHPLNILCPYLHFQRKLWEYLQMALTLRLMILICVPMKHLVSRLHEPRCARRGCSVNTLGISQLHIPRVLKIQWRRSEGRDLWLSDPIGFEKEPKREDTRRMQLRSSHCSTIGNKDSQSHKCVSNLCNLSL